MNRRVLVAAAILHVAAASSCEGIASAEPRTASPVCEREMARASQRHDVPLGVLYAVGMTETGRKGSLQPWALNVEGEAVYSETVEEGVHRLDAALEKGARLVDVGCMQIDYHYHRSRFRSTSDMFDPSRNVDYAARFLKDLRRQESTWTLAVARYHAGPSNIGAQKRYVCAVVANMVAAGFGAWTPEARDFCR